MDWQTLLEGIFLQPIHLAQLSLPFSLLALLLELILPWIGILLLYKLINKGLGWTMKNMVAAETLRNRILRILKIVLRTVLVVIFFVLVARLFGARAFEYMGILIKAVNEPFFVSGETKISLLTLILMLPVFYLAAWVAKLTKSFMENTLLKPLDLDVARRFSITNITRYAVMAVVILFGLSVIGIDLSSLAVLFGVLGIGLGFGLQNTVANFFAGMVIIFSRPIKEHDRILVNDDIEGTVVHIRMLSTIISTLNHETIVVPNSHLVENTVHNYSYDDRRVMIINPVQVAYKSDLDKVIEVLYAVAERNPFSIQHSPAEVIVRSFDSSGITVELWTWLSDVTHKKQAFSWTNLEIWRAFRENGVEIPFPQMDLHYISNKTGEKILPVQDTEE